MTRFHLLKAFAMTSSVETQFKISVVSKIAAKSLIFLSGLPCCHQRPIHMELYVVHRTRVALLLPITKYTDSLVINVSQANQILAQLFHLVQNFQLVLQVPQSPRVVKTAKRSKEAERSSATHYLTTLQNQQLSPPLP